MQRLSLDEVKKLELDLLKYIDEICREKDIKYSLIGGTLLGAIRHGGFIPWDDDIDICVPISEYYKLLDALKNKSEQYVLRCDKDKDYYYYHAKLIDNRTLAIEPNRPYDNQMGVWVDIFPLIGIPNNICINHFIDLCDKANRAVFASIKNNWYYSPKRWKRIVKMVYKLPFMIITKTIGQKKLKQKRNDLFFMQSFENASKVGVVPTQYGIRTIFPKKMFDSYTDILFEGLKMMIIEEWDECLTIQYGDYRKLPPESERVTDHFEAYWRHEENRI